MRPLQDVDYAAERLGLPQHRVYDMVRQGLLDEAVVRLGRRVKFDPDRLEQFIAEGGRAHPGGWRREGRSEASPT